MVSKVIRELFVDYDNFEKYDSDLMARLVCCKINEACIMLDFKEKYFKKKHGSATAVLNYRISIDSDELLWIKLTAPEIILKEVSTSL